MKRRTLAAALAALLALAACATPRPAPTTPPPSPGPAPVLSGTLELVAVDAATGAPVPGARVDVDQTPVEDDGRTDGNGYWSRQLRQGPIAYEVHADGYAAAAGVAELAGPP
ncbi:MAG: carboxypeptidase-like regulatory domain-containing protein, partial [Vicinamibacterales bacterium]